MNEREIEKRAKAIFEAENTDPGVAWTEGFTSRTTLGQDTVGGVGEDVRMRLFTRARMEALYERLSPMSTEALLERHKTLSATMKSVKGPLSLPNGPLLGGDDINIAPAEERSVIEDILRDRGIDL
jgi:hypothetical protein